MDIYVVNGGIGKHVMFSSLITDLFVKNGEKQISIISAYPDIFKYHPHVLKSVSFDEPGFYDKYILREDTNIFYADPYFSNYVKGKTHLTDEWGKLFDIENVNHQPDIWVDDFAVEEAERFKENHKEFIIVQFSGGQSPININPNIPHINHGQIRDYPRHLAQELVNKIKEKYDNLTILNYALPNEQTANLENTISIQAPYLFYVALSQICDGYICIDSSLMHFAANRYNTKKGIVIWGSTGPKNLGYLKNLNLYNDNYSIRPLTNTLGDIFNEDSSQFQLNKDIKLPKPDKILNLLKDIFIENSENSSPKQQKFINSTINEERKKREIDIDINTSQLLMGLNAQSNGLQNQINNLIEQIKKSKNLNGNYTLSNDGTKLIKV